MVDLEEREKFCDKSVKDWVGCAQRSLVVGWEAIEVRFVGLEEHRIDQRVGCGVFFSGSSA